MKPNKVLLGTIFALALATTAFGATSDTVYRARQDGFSLSQKTSRITYSEHSNSVKISLCLPSVPADSEFWTHSLCLIDNNYRPSSGEFSVDEIHNGVTYEKCYRTKTHKCSKKAMSRANQIFVNRMKELDLIKYEKRWLSEKDDIILGKWAD